MEELQLEVHQLVEDEIIPLGEVDLDDELLVVAELTCESQNVYHLWFLLEEQWKV